MSPKFFAFLAWVWISSTIICLIIEGTWIGSAENTIINDLTAFGAFKIGGIASIPVPNLLFFRGVFRILLWDFSFYTGAFEVIRYIWLVVFTGSAIYGLSREFVPVVANFLKFW